MFRKKYNVSKLDYLKVIIYLRKQLEISMLKHFNSVKHPKKIKTTEKEVKVLSYFILNLLLSDDEYSTLIMSGFASSDEGVDMSDIVDILDCRLVSYKRAYKYYMDDPTAGGLNFGNLIYGYCILGKEILFKDFDAAVEEGIDPVQAHLAFMKFFHLGLQPAVEMLTDINKKIKKD